MIKHRVISGLLALLAAGIFLADVLGFPGLYMPTVAYAVPILAAAYFLPSPRTVAGIAVFTLALQIVAYLLEGSGLPLLPASYVLGLGFMSALSVVLSDRVMREAGLRTRLEATVQQLQAQKEARQVQSEEIQSQSEELQAQNEELQAQGVGLERLAEERATIIESIADAVFVCDERGVITVANRAGLELIGEAEVDTSRSLSDYLNVLQLRFLDGRPVPLEDLAISRAVRGETVTGLDRVGVHPVTGQMVDLLISAAPLHDRLGRTVGGVEVAADVTRARQAQREKERLLSGEKEARAEAQRRAAELANVLDNMVEAVFVCDTKGRTTTANQAAVRLLGLSGRDGAELTIEDLRSTLHTRHPNGRPILASRQPLVRALAGETLRHEDLVVRIPHANRDVYLRVSAAPLRDGQGAIVGAVSLSEDVTELTELDRLKDQFITVAAHELKTPVAIIKGFSQLMLRQAVDVSPNRRKILESIDKGADRINGVVEELLDISRLQEGQLDLARERIDLSQLVEQAVDEMSLGATKHRLRVMRADRLVVEGDRARIEQVIVNLLDNAMRYCPEGCDVEVELARDGAEAIVSVMDQGVGIPADKQARMFQRFYRAHTGTPYDYGGMGVSLYISNEIIARHGGRMWFESEEGKGSTFHFSLPFRGANERS